MKFGYLVPEFPGQTHTFFWREVNALQRLGFDPQLVSTRKPRKPMLPPSTTAAKLRIDYLSPPSLPTITGAVLVLLMGVLNGNSRSIRLEFTVDRHVAGFTGYRFTPRDWVKKFGLLLAGAELAWIARRRGWSHIHVHSCADAAQVALFAHKLSGVAYSLTLHGPLGDYGPNQRGKWLSADFATVITDALFQEISRSLGADVAARTSIAPMGVDVDRFSRDIPYEPWPGKGAVRVFSCGRLNPGKGHDILLHAIRELAVDGMDIYLTIAGEDDAAGRGYRQIIENLIVSLDLTQRVTLLGAVTEDEVRYQLLRSHLFALASHAEPLGVAIMEAMSMEVPVVVTESSGVKELVHDGVDGILVSPGDADQLADAVRRVLRDQRLASSLSLAARECVALSFNSSRSATALAGLLSRSSSRCGPTQVDAR